MVLIRKIILIFAVIFISSNVYAVTDIEIKYEDCRDAYQKLTGSKKKRMRHNWIRVIKCFEDVALSKTENKRTKDALFTLGMLYKHLYSYSSIDSDLNNSLRYFAQVSERYPYSSLADDAILNRGKIFLNKKGEYTKAYLELSELIDKYPTSDSAKKARPLLAKIKKSKPKDYETKEVVAESAPVRIAPKNKGSHAVIKDIKHWTNPNYTRVAIYLDSKAEFNYNTLDVDETNLLPRRIYVDIEGSTFSPQISGKIPIKDGLLTRARVGKPKRGIARVVLDAEKEFDYNIFAWEKPFRIIIDIKRKGQKLSDGKMIVDLTDDVAKQKTPEVEPLIPKKTTTTKTQAKKKTPAKKARAKEEKKGETKKVALVATPVARKSREYIKRIVIDAGHGGNDTGAIGRNGTMEKNIVLGIAKRLRDTLSKERDIEVIMTREEDVFIPLEERTGIAVQAQADLFISIHADAHKNRKVTGVSTYFLGDTDDKDSIMTALKENYSTSDYVGGIQSKETKDLLSYTFVSLQKNYDAIRSVPLADAVQKEMLKNLRKKYGSIKNRGVRKGIFWVLCGTNSPAVLIESSYISNPTEEKRLRSDRYQNLLAEGIAKGIRSYLKNPVAMSGYDYVRGSSQSK